jgi:hypothetical protein
MKHQVDIWCGKQSYIYRTNSAKEVARFVGLKKLTAETIGRFLQDLHLRLGQYDIPLAPEPRKKKEKPEIPVNSFKQQLFAKMESKGLKQSPKKIEKMSEGEAQVKLFNLLQETNGQKAKPTNLLSKKQAYRKGLMPKRKAK